ncbi:MAG: type II and III secretion system protein [Verrucomicrobia bacterium]|nr:MAG: type II and III secretion system protein [Verrucomicrobiota bacterium]
MKTTPQSVRSRGSRSGCNPLGNQQKGTKLTKASIFRASFIRRFCRGSRVGCNSLILAGDTPATTIIVNTFRTKCLGVRCVLASLLGFAAVCVSSSAQTPDNVAEREVQRRQAGISQGEAALARGRAAMKAKDYGAAHEEFRMAVTYLPDAVVSGKAHDEAVEGFCKSGVVLAEARIAEGRYADAEAILSEILSDRYDPKCRPAQELYSHLRQPGYFNKTMSPTFIEKVEQVKQLLTEADGFYQSGRYDLAMKRYDQVLALDPYNTAARKGQEKINNTKYRYGEEAYNETRSRQLWQVQKGWEQPVRRYGQTGEPVAIGAQKNLGGTAQVNNKLNTIIIPRVEFRDATLREAVNFLREQAVENDPATQGERGINIVLPPSVVVQRPPPSASASPAAAGAAAAAPGTAPTGTPPVGANQAVGLPPAPPAERGSITLELNHIPLGEALRYIANQAGLKVKVEPYAVSLVPRTEQSGDLLVKRYRVPPEFFGGPLDVGYYIEGGLGASQTGAGGSAQPAPVAENIIQKEAVSYQTASGVGTGAGATSQSNLVQGTSTTRQHLLNDRQLVGRADAKTTLQSMGVQFPIITLPDGRVDTASATFWPHTGVLIVRNTQDNLDMVDALVDQANASQPKQVEIESKFIEITQNNLKELGFDWLLGPFNIGNHKLFGAGGTSANSSAANPANFPFVNTTGQPIGDTLPGQAIGQFPVTGGNRSGGLAISANALDALLFPGASGVAPGIFGLAGVFTDPQFQVVIRALNQKKGVDLLSAPKVTTKSGQRAIIEVVREFRYPSTFTPPQVPSISSSTGNTVVGGATTVPVVVTPTTPQNWETRNTGVTLEVEPVVGGDATTIDLNLVPQVVEFEGFINYGSPINAVGVNTVGGVISTSVPVLLTENVINQPVFSTRKVTTSLSVYDGQTVVLGGLMREDVQKTEDKTPIIGDIPLVGRLFRTNVDQHIKRNLVIFVTARVITPSGLAFNNEEEEEEGLLPPALPEAPAYKK